MPATPGGLAIFVLLTIPGFVHNVQRRSRVPQRRLSPFVETASLVTVSVASDLAALLLFSLLRRFSPAHTPDLTRLVTDGMVYAGPRFGYLLVWLALLVLIACAFATVFALRPSPFAAFLERFSPAIVDVSAWYHAFEEAPDGMSVFCGIVMDDGAYVEGPLDWYSTEVEESADRDLVLAKPIRYRPAGQSNDEPPLEFERIIVSSRNIRTILVSYLVTDVP